MTGHRRRHLFLSAAVALTAAVLAPVMGAAGIGAGPVSQASKGAAMARQATGTFTVKAQPLPADEKVPGLKVGRVGVDKRFEGGIDGTSKGEMMTVETAVAGSAGYVAVEQVSGTLGGRRGTFALLHQGTMQGGGNFKLSVIVVPDSGTGQLTGLAGSMTILIEGGKHSYTMDYTLPDQP